jgi:hypothetical protein
LLNWPVWAHAPLLLLGIAFILDAPFVPSLLGIERWTIYIFFLVLAAMYSLWCWRSVRFVVVEKTEEAVTTRAEWRRAGAKQGAEEERSEG